MSKKKKGLTDIEFQKAIGDRMRVLRKQKTGMSAENFALEIEMSTSLYGKYENGRNLTVNSLLKIMNGLGVTPTEFFAEGWLSRQ